MVIMLPKARWKQRLQAEDFAIHNAADKDENAAHEDDADGDGTDDNYSFKDKMEAVFPSRGWCCKL